MQFYKRSIAAAAVALAAGIGAATAQDTYPDQNITWLIPYGAGGGTDVWSRLAGQIMNQEGISDATFIYENRPGGSGVRGLLDVINDHKGDENLLFSFDPVIYTPWLKNEIEQNYKDITIVAGVALDRHVLLVPGDSPIDSPADLVAADEEPVTIGHGPAGAFPAQIFVQESGINARLVPFEGDSQVMAALLGGHVDAIFSNPSEVLGQVEAGTMKALAIAAPERIAVLPDVPTFKEAGFDVEFGMVRGVGMGPGVPEEVKQYWIDSFQKLTETDAWKEQYINQYALDGRFMASDDFVKYIEEEAVPLYRDVLEKQAQQAAPQ